LNSHSVWFFFDSVWPHRSFTSANSCVRRMLMLSGSSCCYCLKNDDLKSGTSLRRD
jgi:hypothetical protein